MPVIIIYGSGPWRLSDEIFFVRALSPCPPPGHAAAKNFAAAWQLVDMPIPSFERVKFRKNGLSTVRQSVSQISETSDAGLGYRRGLLC